MAPIYWKQITWTMETTNDRKMKSEAGIAIFPWWKLFFQHRAVWDSDKQDEVATCSSLLKKSAFGWLGCKSKGKQDSNDKSRVRCHDDLAVTCKYSTGSACERLQAKLKHVNPLFGSQVLRWNFRGLYLRVNMAFRSRVCRLFLQYPYKPRSPLLRSIRYFRAIWYWCDDNQAEPVGRAPPPRGKLPQLQQRFLAGTSHPAT